MTDQPDIHTLTGAYAVDALPDEEREVFEHHLLMCDACAQEVAGFQATASRLGALSYELPPPSLRARVLAEIDATRQERPDGIADHDADGDGMRSRRSVTGRVGSAADRGGRRLPARGATWLTGLSVAAAAVLLVAVAGLSLVIADLNDRIVEVESASSTIVANLNDRIAQIEGSSRQVTDVLAAPDVTVVSLDGPSGGMGRVVASPARGEAVFLVDDMVPAPHGHTYELWLIEPDTFVKAGLFDPDDRGRATRIMTGDFARAAAIGVTIEPIGGSPQPTTDPVMVFELG